MICKRCFEYIPKKTQWIVSITKDDKIGIVVHCKCGYYNLIGIKEHPLNLCYESLEKEIKE